MKPITPSDEVLQQFSAACLAINASVNTQLAELLAAGARQLDWRGPGRVLLQLQSNATTASMATLNRLWSVQRDSLDMKACARSLHGAASMQADIAEGCWQGWMDYAKGQAEALETLVASMAEARDANDIMLATGAFCSAGQAAGKQALAKAAGLGGASGPALQSWLQSSLQNGEDCSA
ncbi:hypothetical protein [Massilia sp. BJB1822]|uniref:hypothetical protein n=1 Tax=Massilia sp. BJB1822 TaxID=2744470 RepID=UPI001593D887|nr:hypothetical protein [Massilia sp. BJB1822]NVE01093.1 hypothetical protein [Massilia sp. BJB1822]